MDTPQILRLYADLPQPVSEGALFINGLDAEGNALISYDTNGYHQAYQLAIPAQGQNYVDSTVQISHIFSIAKPVTKGRLKLYSVDPTTQAQSLIGVYAPTEVAPDYRRYRLTWCGALVENTTIILQVKRQFIFTTDPEADLLITNVGALQEALMGLKYSKSGPPQLADYHWNQAGKILEAETIDYMTDRSPSMQLQDTFAGGDVWNLR
jgi:hypothetical protein